MTDSEFFNVWNIRFSHRRDDIVIQGSPNRSEERFAVEDISGNLYISEGFDLRKSSKQCRQNELLEFLKSHEMSVTPWIRTNENKHGYNSMARFWQIRPFISGKTLPRDSIGDNLRFAHTQADFLLQLKRASCSSGFPVSGQNVFYLSDYVPGLRNYISSRMPSLASPLETLLKKMNSFFQTEKNLPLTFAHGDFHPGNFLMRRENGVSVIDWEFTGWKCAGYDFALLAGCLGADNSLWLSNGCIPEMFHVLKNNDYWDSSVIRILPGITAAIRLGWLGEWVMLNDSNLAEGEIQYIDFLLNYEYPYL